MLTWNQQAVEKALEQAIRYAVKQKVEHVAITDSTMLYTANLNHGALDDRLLPRQPIQKLHKTSDGWAFMASFFSITLATIGRLRPEESLPEGSIGETNELPHPKYQLPVSCFAYVGNPSQPATWKLLYCLSDGGIDEKRLAKAIQAILSNYCRVKVSCIPA